MKPRTGELELPRAIRQVCEPWDGSRENGSVTLPGRRRPVDYFIWTDGTDIWWQVSVPVSGTGTIRPGGKVISSGMSGDVAAARSAVESLP